MKKRIVEIVLFGLIFQFGNLDSAHARKPAQSSIEASTPIFSIQPSTSTVVQGQSFSLVIKPLGSYPNVNLDLAATVDDGTFSVSQPAPRTWLVTLAPYAAVGAHSLTLSLGLEDSKSSADLAGLVNSLNRRITEIQSELSNETDLKIIAKLNADLTNQKNILRLVLADVSALHTTTGSQVFSFQVKSNDAIGGFPRVASVSPNVGSIDGANPVVITGSNFRSGASVKFGGIQATEVRLIDSSTISAVTPVIGILGSTDVEVDLPPLADGEVPSGVLVGGFFAIPHSSPTINSPPVAITGGSQVISIGQSADLDGSQSFSWGGDAVSYRWNFLSTPSNSSLHSGDLLSVNAKSAFIPDVYGVYVIELRVSETSGAMLTSAPSLAVIESIGGPPVPSAPSIQAISGVTATAQISVQDPNNVAESYAILSPPNHGSAIVNASGLLSYTSDPAYVGTDDLQIQVRNQYGFSANISIHINVEAPGVGKLWRN
jgi:hypothetical protein